MRRRLVIEDGTVPEPVAKFFERPRCTAFVGSGMSTGPYLPWYALINEICERCGLEERVSEDSTARQLVSATERAKAADPAGYFETIGVQFGGPIPRIPSAYYTLVSLPFDSFLTLNFDRLLHAAATKMAVHGSPVSLFSYPNLYALRAHGGAIHHLHGYVPEGKTPVDGDVVLASGEFARAYSPTSPLVQFLTPILENEPILFVGCGLSEPGMEQVFTICRQHQHERLRLAKAHGQSSDDPPPRFIFTPIPAVTTETGRIDALETEAEVQRWEAFYRELEIEPVWYDRIGGGHSILWDALERLAEPPRIDPPLIEPQFGWPRSRNAR